MNGDSRMCFNMANAFYDVGRFANEYDAEAQNATILFKCDAYYAFPAIVNLSFACELFLKVLLHQVGFDSDIHGHHLDKLFCKLPKTTQELMSKRFAEECRYDVSLQQTLEIHAKAFENWRYAFEADKKNVEAYPDNLQLAAEVIREACRKIN